MQILSIMAQIFMTIATITIAVYAYNSYKLSSEIKQASETNQRNINKLFRGFVVSSLFIAKYSSTGQKSIKIEEFDYKYREVEKYFATESANTE